MPRPEWLPLSGGLDHVRLDGDRPAMRTQDGRFLRLHAVPDAVPDDAVPDAVPDDAVPGNGPTGNDLTYHRAGKDRLSDHGRTAGTAARGTLERYLDRLNDVADARRRDLGAARWPEGRRRIAVVGQDALASALAEALRDAGAEVTRIEPGTNPATHPDAVVAVLDDAPSPGLARRLDAHLARGTAVLHGHREGDHFHLLPLAVDGTEATADQVRRRRIAASPAAPELDSWLAATPPPARRLADLARGAIVSACLTVLSDWAAGAPELTEHRRTLRVLDEHLRLHTHTVLGFDEPAAR